MQIFTQTKHINEDTLGLHAMNDLPESQSGVVAAHLSSCGQCRSQFKEVQDFIALFRLAAKGNAPLASRFVM